MLADLDLDLRRWSLVFVPSFLEASAYLSQLRLPLLQRVHPLVLHLYTSEKTISLRVAVENPPSSAAG